MASPRISKPTMTATPAMDPLDPGLRVVERREDLAVAERPIGAAEPRIGRADDDADRDEHERGQEGRAGELLEAGHEARHSIAGARRRSGPRRYPVARCPTFPASRCPGRARPRLAACTRRPRARPPVGARRHPALPRRRCATAPPPESPEGWGAPAMQPSVIPVIVRPTHRLRSRRGSSSRSSTTTTASSSCPGPDGLGRVLRPRRGPRRRRSRPPTARSSGRSRTSAACTSPTSTLPEAGTWGAEFTTEAPGSPRDRSGSASTSLESSPIVQVGDTAPASDTPTARRRRTATSRRSRRTPSPNPAFYETSVADALAATKPFVLVFATPKFCTSAQCGPTLDRLKPVAAAHPDVTFINVEPYQLQLVDGQLQPVLDANGELQATTTTNEWGLVERAVDLRGRRRGRRPRLLRADHRSEAELETAHRGDHARPEPRQRVLEPDGAVSSDPRSRYQTRMRRPDRLVLGEVAGRETDAVLQPDARSPGSGPSSARSVKPLTPSDPADRPRRTTPLTVFAPAAGLGWTDPPPSMGAAPPVTARTTTSTTAKRLRPSIHRRSGCRRPCSPEHVAGDAVRAARAGGRSRLVGRQVELPERAQRIDAPGRRRGQRGPAAAPIDEHGAFDDLAAHGLDRRQHREQRATRREDVVDEQDALARLDPEARVGTRGGSSRPRRGPPPRRWLRTPS